MFTKIEKAIKIGGQEIGENTTKRKLVHKIYILRKTLPASSSSDFYEKAKKELKLLTHCMICSIYI
jgi:hypothetical protein